MEGLASVIIVTYNHRRYLEPCITSVLQQNYPHEIIVVDNRSHDGSAELVKERYPTVKLIESSENKGYGAGNNLGVKHAKGEYIVILNPDTIVENGWLRELIAPIETESGIITTPKILLYDGSAINTCGNLNHFTGLTFTRGLDAKPEAYSMQEYVSGFSGCCFALRKEDFLELGGFDEDFFTYNEDSDLSWRAHVEGFTILFIPTAVLRHDYALKVPPEKVYYLEKGRYTILKKYLAHTDFLLLAPSLLVAELLTFGYALKHGKRGLTSKFKAVKDGLFVKVDKVQGDKAKLFKSLSVAIPVEQLTSNSAERILKVFANKIFAWNFRVKCIDNVQPIQKKIIEIIMLKYINKTSKDSIILDIGCRLGDWLKIVSKQRKVIGLETNSIMVDYTNYSIKEPLSLGIIIYDGINFQFKDETFNMIYLIEVIEHIKEDERFLSECYRVLKKDGYFLLTTPNREKEPLNPNIHDGHVRHYTKFQIISKLDKVGFRVEKFYWRMHPLCSYLDCSLTQIGRKYLKKDIYFGHNVSIYQPKKGSNFLISLYKLIEPILVFLVSVEFELLKNKVQGKNMLIIARK